MVRAKGRTIKRTGGRTRKEVAMETKGDKSRVKSGGRTADEHDQQTPLASEPRRPPSAKYRIRRLAQELDIPQTAWE